MSAYAIRLAARLTRLWVYLYTLGLPPKMKDVRRQEIESDLWEQGFAEGGKPEGIAPHVLARWLLGIPADLLWRLEQVGAETTPQRRRSPLGSRGRMAVTAGAFLLSAAFLGGAGLVMSQGIIHDWLHWGARAGFIVAGTAIALGGLFIGRVAVALYRRGGQLT